MKSINQKRLAKELNLSVATVSRALNDRYDISQATKDRVNALAAELNYEPNPYASSLRRHKSGTIGVIIPEVDNHFFSLVINGIEEVARHNKYHVLIYLTHEDWQREAEMVRLLTNGRVDGVLVSVASSSQCSAHFDLLKERIIPAVFFDRVYPNLDYPKVTTDDYESGYKATRYLLEAGCRVVAHLTISENLTISQRRKQGYVAALRSHGLEPDEQLVLTEQSDKVQDVRMIEELLKKHPAIDGVFAAVESWAMSCYEACNNLGLRIGTDIKVIGFSNLASVSLLAPALTTITQPAYNIGKEAAGILFQAITKNQLLSSRQSKEIKSELFVRASTGQ